MDPWGIPHLRGADEDVNSPMVTEKLLFVKYQFKTTPSIPTNLSSCEIRISWSIVSNAALKSSNTKTAAFPESTVNKISLRTFKSADSVLWCFLKQDWNSSTIKFSFKKDYNWIRTAFSSIFERNYNFEIGLKLFNSFEFRLVFLIKGCTIACLKISGTDPDTKQLIIIFKKLGPTVTKACFIIFDETISSGESDGLNWSTIFLN